MDYWKTKVLPRVKKTFGRNGTKKAAAAEACKSFDDSKEGYAKEFEDKKSELQPKVVEIYEASAVEIKTLVKEPKEAGLKKHSAGVQKFLDELAKIDFPGSKPISEASTKVGPTLVPGPIFFVFEKVSTFIVTEEKPVEPPPAEAETSVAEVVVEEEKKEEEVAVVAEPEAVAEAATTTEPPPKVEEPVEAEPPKP